MELTGFYYVELQELTRGKPFAGMAAGSFVDMSGRHVELGAVDMAAFVENTNAFIAEFKGRGMPGLPIDARRHDKGDAAGWIVAAEAGEVRSGEEVIPAVNLTAEWTQLGLELLQGRMMTNFSPTIDLTNKTIRGGSLTNWPASVDKNGVPLFAAVELAQGIRAIAPLPELEQGVLFKEHDVMTIEVTNEQLDEMVDARVKAQLAELNAQLPAQLAEALGVAGDAQVANIAELAEVIRKQEQARWQQQLADLQRRSKYADLAADFTGGTSDAPRGIPAKADDLRDALLKLPAEQAEFWLDLLGNIQRAGLAEFSEVGHGKRTNGKRELPAEYAAALDAGELQIADLALPMFGIDPADYDLSKWN